MPPLLQNINVSVLFVDDLQRSISFYRDTVGLDLQFEDPNSGVFTLGSVTLLLLDTAGAIDLLSPDAVSSQSDAGARSQLVSFVEDVDAVYRALSERGVNFIREPVDRAWGMRTAHFRDPDGHVWELAQQLA